ncbi:cell division protein FtsL [Thalassobacillus sp. CUG 92003]|uniref:cell division protein FtsL n=1 Tax=Thalassobacillus sp. CUG 92003 TaxID=2736641 RepID=UPI0015E6BF40|nr:cell division protein FtsL [Thalassobacillus sp. CUG 92003]
MSIEKVKDISQTNQHSTQQDEQKVKVKVHKKRWITPGEKLLYAVSTSIVIAASVLMVQFTSATDTLNRDVQKLEQKIEAQQAQNETLQYEEKELSNPDRILRIAKENGLKIQNAQVKQANAIGN